MPLPVAALAPLDPHALVGLREHVHRALRQVILQGGFEPGARLNERAIAEQLGVSTTPVKEALRLLEADGLVRTKPRSGVIVNYLRLLNDRQDVYDSGARRVIHSDPAERQQALTEHRQIGRAVIAGDPDAAEVAMKAHVLRAGDSYLDLVFRKKKD